MTGTVPAHKKYVPNFRHTAKNGSLRQHRAIMIFCQFISLLWRYQHTADSGLKCQRPKTSCHLQRHLAPPTWIRCALVADLPAFGSAIEFST